MINRGLRRALLALGALALIASGMAGVSAFEAHIINVSARVENALSVTPPHLGIGDDLATTVVEAAFPTEWLKVEILVNLSGSFTQQTRVSNVSYIVCAEAKPATYGVIGVDSNPYHATTNPTGWKYLWMGGAAYVSVDSLTGPYTWIGPSADIIPPATAFCTAVSGILSLSNPGDTVYIWLDVPIFGAYDPSKVPCDLPRPDTSPHNPLINVVCQYPSVILPIPPANRTGTDLGMDIKIQVTNIQ